MLDSIFNIFLGYNFGYFNYIELLKLIVFNSIPLYLLCVFYENEKNSISPIILVRCKSRLSYFLKIQFATFIFILIYLLIQIICNITISFIFLSKKLEPNLLLDIFNIYNFNTDNIYYLIFFSIFLRFLELTLLQLIFLVILSVLKNITLSFYVNIGFYCFLIFDNIYIKYLPHGISSIYRILNYDDNLFKSIIMCFITISFTSFISFIYLNLIKFKNLL